MRHTHFIILFAGVLFIGCKKKQEDILQEVRGTKFDLLTKTIDTYTDGKSVTDYSYNGQNQLIQENSVRTFFDSTKWKVNNTWYRNPAGQPDSMKSEFTYGTDPTGVQKQYYHYDASGALSYCILYRNIINPYSSIDSCVYFYSGALVVKRLDYTSALTTILHNTLTHEMYYQYDGLNNISAITFVNYDFSAGASPKKDTVTLSYNYDEKKNPYFQNESFYSYYVSLSFEDYASKNNIVQIMYNGKSVSNDKDIFSIQYNSASKPDRLLVTSYGVGSTRPIIWTTDYYYN